jgi:hypothetical protein
MFCRSVRIKSHRNDAPLYRGRSYDQERAPERIVPMYSPLALINADDTRLAFLAFTLIFRDLLNETQTQSQFATDTRNIQELGISESIPLTEYFPFRARTPTARDQEKTGAIPTSHRMSPASLVAEATTSRAIPRSKHGLDLA